MRRTVKNDAEVCDLDAWEGEDGIKIGTTGKKGLWMFFQIHIETNCIPGLFLGTERQKVSFPKAAGHLNLNSEHSQASYINFYLI